MQLHFSVIALLDHLPEGLRFVLECLHDAAPPRVNRLRFLCRLLHVVLQQTGGEEISMNKDENSRIRNVNSLPTNDDDCCLSNHDGAQHRPQPHSHSPQHYDDAADAAAVDDDHDDGIFVGIFSNSYHLPKLMECHCRRRRGRAWN